MADVTTRTARQRWIARLDRADRESTPCCAMTDEPGWTARVQYSTPQYTSNTVGPLVVSRLAEGMWEKSLTGGGPNRKEHCSRGCGQSPTARWSRASSPMTCFVPASLPRRSALGGGVFHSPSQPAGSSHWAIGRMVHCHAVTLSLISSTSFFCHPPRLRCRLRTRTIHCRRVVRPQAHQTHRTAPHRTTPHPYHTTPPQQ